MSLRTRHFREAEHRAALLDRVFHEALARARAAVSEGAPPPDLNAILRDYLREALERDLEARLNTSGSRPLYYVPGVPNGGGNLLSPREADLEVIGLLIAEACSDLEARDARAVARDVDALMARHHLPEYMRNRLAVGLLEARLKVLEEVERRTLGLAPLVFHPEVSSGNSGLSGCGAAPPPPPPPKPCVSALVEPFFVRRKQRDRASAKQMDMERTTLRLFQEVCGDKPVDAYHRGDITRFLDTLRQLPNTYGKSPRDRERSLSEIIKEADAEGRERLTDRTVQRHLTALAQFFQFAVDGGHLTVAGRAELVENHRFREARGAREQRDIFTSAELTALFATPVWRGRHPFFRDRKGREIIRDAYFWLPLLALYHGARLEELADLHKRDLGCDEGTWFFRITDEGGRRLKNANAKRIVPLHPEVIRMGFLETVVEAAPQPDAPLFPELPQRGKDKRRGVDVTKWFTRYRRKFDLGREGLSFHSFRHTAITRLSDAITTEQQRRHRDRMMGHGSGGGSEGDIRYDKGPGLKAMAETLALLRYPEAGLSHLYLRDAP